MFPVCRDKGEDLVQLKVFLLAADRQVVENQVNEIDPPQRETTDVL